MQVGRHKLHLQHMNESVIANVVRVHAKALDAFKPPLSTCSSFAVPHGSAQGWTTLSNFVVLTLEHEYVGSNGGGIACDACNSIQLNGVDFQYNQ